MFSIIIIIFRVWILFDLFVDFVTKGKTVAEWLVLLPYIQMEDTGLIP